MVHYFIVDVAMTEFVKLTIHFNRDYFIFLPCIVYVVINSPVGVEMVLLKKISIVSKVISVTRFETHNLSAFRKKIRKSEIGNHRICYRGL